MFLDEPDFTLVLPFIRRFTYETSTSDSVDEGDTETRNMLKQAVDQSKIDPNSKRLSTSAWKRLKATGSDVCQKSTQQFRKEIHPRKKFW